MGFVDRGGGREAKGASLRRSKNNPGAAAARKASSIKPQPLTRVTPLAPTFRDGMQHVDASLAILSRKFSAGCSELLLRAAREGEVAAALTWCGNFEQQEALIELCRKHNVAAAVSGNDGCSTLYCVVGVHVNSIDRTHKQQQEKWVESVVTWTRHQEVIGLMSGFSLSRDSCTHFAQEWLLRELWRKSGELQLPIVLHVCPDEPDRACAALQDTAEHSSDNGGLTDNNFTVDRAAELIDLMCDRAEEADCEEGCGARAKNPTAVVLHNGVGALSCSSAMRELVKKCAPNELSEVPACRGTRCTLPIYVLATAEGLTTSSSSPGAYRPSFVHSLRNHVSVSQLLIGTNSPWSTPQNIPDEYVRTMHNEPANYPYVALAVHQAINEGVSEVSPAHEEFCATVRDNFLRVFFSSSTNNKQSPHRQHAGSVKTGEVTDKKVEEASSKPPLHYDPSIKTLADAVKVSPESTRYYLCLKCRKKLFHERALLTHPPDAARAHFNGPQTSAGKGCMSKGKQQSAVGLCDSVCFLRIIDNPGDGVWCVEESGVVVHRSNATVSCGGCGSKLGTAAVDCTCPCGCTVAGISARLAATKVEAPVGRRARCDLDELLLEAARERDRLVLEGEMLQGCRGDSDDGGNGKRKVKEPKKNVKTNNRSNFTHFRNKNFAPKQAKGQQDEFGGVDVPVRDVDAGGPWNAESGEEQELETATEACRRGRHRQKKKGNRHNLCGVPSD